MPKLLVHHAWGKVGTHKLPIDAKWCRTHFMWAHIWIRKKKKLVFTGFILSDWTRSGLDWIGPGPDWTWIGPGPGLDLDLTGPGLDWTGPDWTWTGPGLDWTWT